MRGRGPFASSSGELDDLAGPAVPNLARGHGALIGTLSRCASRITRRATAGLRCHTTNAIESVNSVIRKFTRNRKIYPNEESALKIVYMAIQEASRKWTMPIHHWKQALNHFAILFEGRMPETCSK